MTALASARQARFRRNARIAAILAVVALLVVAKLTGVLERVRDPAGLRDSLVALGPWGYVVYIGAYTVLQPFGVPGSVFIWGAPLIWPWPVAFALSMVATMCASVVGFVFARFVARDYVAARIPERFRRYDEALARRAFPTVFWLRSVFWMPPFLHAFFGVSSVGFWTHFWGSLLAYILPMLAVSYFGEQMLRAMLDAPAWAWALAAVVAVAAAGAWWWRRGRLPAAAPR